MDHTFLDRCLRAVRSATCKQVNALLGRQAAEAETIATATIRADTTVVEANIYWPTDASLLWDTWQVASRQLRRDRDLVPESCQHRFHNRKTKALYLFITRSANIPSKERPRALRGAFRKLIALVAWIVETAGVFCQLALGWGPRELTAVVDNSKRSPPSMKP